MSVDFNGTTAYLDYGDLRNAGADFGYATGFDEMITGAQVKGDASGSAERIWHYIASTQGPGLLKLATNAYRWAVQDTPQNNRHDTDTTYSTGTWYDIFGQFKASGGADDIDIWRDGTLGTGSRVTTNSPGNITSGGASMLVGAQPGPTNYYDGEIADVYVLQNGPWGYNFFDDTALLEALRDHHFSPFFWRAGLVFYAPLLDATHDADLMTGTDPTQTGSPSKGTGASVYPRIQNFLANGGMFFIGGAGGGGGGGGIKWNGTDIDLNGLTNDKWNGFTP